MSRLRDELFNAKIENATLKLEVKALTREVDELRPVKVNFSAMAARINELEKDKAVLLERLDLLANHLPPAPTQAFNTISEEHEDAEYALRAGLIDHDEFEAILASAGALNTEVTFDSDTSPRL